MISLEYGIGCMCILWWNVSMGNVGDPVTSKLQLGKKPGRNRETSAVEMAQWPSGPSGSGAPGHLQVGASESRWWPHDDLILSSEPPQFWPWVELTIDVHSDVWWCLMMFDDVWWLKYQKKTHTPRLPNSHTYYGHSGSGCPATLTKSCA